MANPLKPGSYMLPATENWSGYAGSMAEAIEVELNLLLKLDGLPQLPLDVSDRELRDRRRFFVAIARGVVRHLHEHADAFTVTVPPHPPHHPTIDWLP
jgi:hypothetical protein